jgi:LmbE family N-acetylglucosaminyl deacetylase
MLWKRNKRASPARFSLRKQRTVMETAIATKEATIFSLKPGQVVLGIDAHPDDYEMFKSAAMQQARDEGGVLVTATATDGGATTLTHEDPDRPWPEGARIEEIRRDEAKRAFAKQGVPEDRQEFYGLADGRLESRLNRFRLGWNLAKTILKHNVSIIVTPGPEGVDGHRDHQVTHEVALFVGKLFKFAGRQIAIWAVNADGEGEQVVKVDEETKLDLLGTHHSQFPLKGPDRSKGLEYAKHYAGFLEKETFDRVL